MAAGSAHTVKVLVHLSSRNRECASPKPCSSLKSCCTKYKSWLVSNEIWPQIPGLKEPLPWSKYMLQSVCEQWMQLRHFIFYNEMLWWQKQHRSEKLCSKCAIHNHQWLQIIPPRCGGDRTWVSVAAWINGNKAVALAASAVIGLILGGSPASDWSAARRQSPRKPAHTHTGIALLCDTNSSGAAAARLPARCPRARTDERPDTCMSACMGVGFLVAGDNF